MIAKSFCRICTAMCGLEVEGEGGNVRALINLPGHILTCMPDAPCFERALEKLEVLITVDPPCSEIGAQFTPTVVPARGEEALTAL